MKFIGTEMTAWNDELIMQFYSTAHFYPDGKIKWMTEGVRYESSVEEWAEMLGLPPSDESYVDVYAKPRR